MRTFLPKSMWLAFAFAALVLLVGLAMVLLGATGESEFEVFGQKLRSANVGLTIVALAVLSFVALVRRVLHSYDALGTGRLEDPKTRITRPVSNEIRETMGRLGEKIELVLSALRSPGTAKSEIENRHEQLEAYVNAHSLFLNQDLYPILSKFKDILHETVNMRIAVGAPNARALASGVTKLIELRNQTMAVLGEMAAQGIDRQPVRRLPWLWLLVVAVLVGAITAIALILSSGHGARPVATTALAPVVVELRMPDNGREQDRPRDAGSPVDAGPRTRLSVVVVPNGRIWIDGRVVGAGHVIRSVTPGRHRVAAGGSGPSTVTQEVDVALGETRHVELAVNNW